MADDRAVAFLVAFIAFMVFMAFGSMAGVGAPAFLKDCTVRAMNQR